MFNWRPKTKGGGRDSSSASDSGDSPTSTISQQAQIPAPADGRHSGQPSSSRRNEPGNSSNSASGTSIAQSAEIPDRGERPIQPTPVLDYQPPEFRGLPPPSSSSKRIYNMPGPAPQPIQDEYYTRNELATFKFGSPSITTMTDTSSQIDPLSSEEDFPRHGADTTPRPSLAANTEGIRSHPSQVSSLSDQSPPVSRRPIRNDASSTHTLGIRSLKSNSTPSLANTSGRDRSQARAETSPEQSSDDEPRAVYYTFPYVESVSSSSVDSNSTRDDFYDDEDFSDPDLEVSSARFDEVGSYDQSYWNTPPDQDSFIADYLAQRRGSNPIAIPGAQEGFSQGRDREDSVATVKYPTPSAPSPSNLSPRSPTAPVPNPLSLPNNEADWDQRRRAIQDRLDASTTRPHPPIQVIDYATLPLSNHAGPSMGAPISHLDDTALEFDMSEWNGISGGIKGGADLGDVDAAPIGAVNPNFWSRFAPNDVPRRPSIASTINDTFQKHALAFRDQDWSFKKDKADGTAHSKKKRNTFIPFNERPLKREPPWRGMTVGQVEFWRNDLTGTYKVERLEVTASENRPPQQRLSVQHVRDGSRQAQGSFPGLTYDPHSGPATTVHKHSKAAAFSLSRHYKSQYRSPEGRNNTSRAQPYKNAVYVHGKKTAMILLAPRKVQEAYTSTTTTRKLESHGLLGDAHRSRELERLRRLAEQDDRLKEKAEMKEKARQEKEQRKAAEERAKRDKGKGKARGQESTNHPEAPAMSQTENEFTSLSISTSQQPVTSPDSLTQTAAETNLPLSEIPRVAPVVTPSTSVSSTIVAHEPLGAFVQQPPSKDVVEHSTPLQTPHELSVQMQHPADFPPESRITNENQVYPFSQDHLYGQDEEEDIDEEDEQLGLVPRRRRRTPHSEAYHALPPESIDSFASQQDTHSRGFLPWLSGRNASSRTLHIDAPYHPPWLSAPSRPNNHDIQMQVVAGLNTSFQGVGLLPTEREIRENRKRRALKNQVRDANTQRKYTKEKDIFTDLSDDALYMLLPLWPYETDPISSRDHPFKAPSIAISDRLYLLVYYKPWYPSETFGKSKSKDKSRRSRGSPTSSQDGIYIDERNVLMSQFYIGARIVAYDDLEGSNVRVPEIGLSVMGPLREASESVPMNDRSRKAKPKGKGKSKDAGEGKEFWDYIIGSYQSRDHPMEFYPEGFARMRLATQQDEMTDSVNISTDGAVSSYSNNSVPSGSTAAAPSGSGSIKEVSSNNVSTSSLASVSSGSGISQLDVDSIAPFGEPPSDNHVNPARFPINSEEDPIQEPPILLTPIGRAVLEMAFMGALAVTGFSPQPYW